MSRHRRDQDFPFRADGGNSNLRQSAANSRNPVQNRGFGQGRYRRQQNVIIDVDPLIPTTKLPSLLSNVYSGPDGGSYNQRPRECHNCKKIGHLSRNCPEPRKDQSTSTNSNSNRNDRPVFGFTRLKGFLNIDEADAVIMEVGRNISEWVKVIESVADKTQDFFPLILHILAKKICIRETILNANQIDIIAATLNDKFIKELQNTYNTITMGEITVHSSSTTIAVDTSKIGILESISEIFDFVIWRCPSLAQDYIQQPILGALGVVSTLLYTKPKEGIEIQAKFLQMIETLKSKKEKQEEVVRKRFNKFDITEHEERVSHETEPPEDFRDIPIIPSIEEILSLVDPFLRTNKKSGGYIDANHYLDVQYRLLRADFVFPLKRGIQDFKKNQVDYLSNKKKIPMGNVRIYTDVVVKAVEWDRDTLVYNIRLPDSIVKKTKWDRSKRLLNGALLVFTHDIFKSAYFGMVAKRETEQLKRGILGVTWEGEIPDSAKTFLMVECEVYFEAYRHTLQILKTIELDTFSLAKFIVKASDEVCAPKYLEDGPFLMSIGGRYVSALGDLWPSADELGFDENQFVAFKAALTKEFSIIQGPPGTGKTFLGLKVTETFLTNSNSWLDEGRGPILVVCYTNHALDQFLEGILDILKRLYPTEDPEMIRVGGRSKCPTLDEFGLNKRRIMASRMRTFDRGFAQARHEAMREVMDLESSMAGIMGEVVALGKGNLEGLVRFDLLSCVTKLNEQISLSVLDSVKNASWFGLSDAVFNYLTFSPNALLQKWFHVTERVPVPHSAPRKNQIEIGDVADEDDEDYDVDELQADRIDDGYKEELTFGLKHRQPIENLKYVDNYAISECQKRIEKCHYKIDDLSVNPERKLTFAEQAIERNRLTTEIMIAENKMKFFEILMASHRDGLLNLPNMSYIFEKDRMITNALLGNLSLAQRWSVYFDLVEKARLASIEDRNKVTDSLVNAQKKLESIRRVGDGQILRKTKVVGMTTTGAAKNHDLLKMMKSKIVIVEEAAEVLESHIVTCITEHCQQLILIGDHQQLRPSTTVYELSTRYNLDISLFERMLNNNLNCYRLKVQHRMREEIADLIVGTIYSELKNHSSVYNYPEIKGMEKNLFFISHNEYEKAESDSMSKSNEHEAKFLAGLCRHLVLQGYATSEITVLTTYTGQMFLLKKEIKNLSSCDGIRVSVVDNYQGEENKIILLSLVRSNNQNNIGFLKTDNRICVAISRAKHGLYITGNMDNLTSRSNTWKQINEKLAKRGEIGTKLKLICEIHGTVTEVETGNDFRKNAPGGGCKSLCNFQLSCTHQCEEICHVMNRDHDFYKCPKPCLKSCSNAHPCKSRCFINCPPCEIKMEKLLPCQHIRNMSCHMDPAKVTCMVMIEKKKPCGHMEELACHKDPATVRCREMVKKLLQCRLHTKAAECHVDGETITCKVNVTKILQPCGHEQVEECHKNPEMIKCITKVEKEFPLCKHKITLDCKDAKNEKLICRHHCSVRLQCGHQCTKLCHVENDPNHITHQCKKQCERECENGHPCPTKHKCYENCPPCKVMMEKLLSCGSHTDRLSCDVDIDSVLCGGRCLRKLPLCGHQCLKLCHEDCFPCQVLVLKMAPCNHKQQVKCSEIPQRTKCNELVKPRHISECGHDTLVRCKVQDSILPREILEYCNRPCNYQFKDQGKDGCTHRCKGSCSKCRQGRLHHKCQEECGKTLVCGHVCTFPCASLCPPCQKPCEMRCEHSTCMAICGEPCSGCKEKCTWSCVHKSCTKRCDQDCDREPCDEPCPILLKCGHPCVGYCGELCSPLCRFCDKEMLTEFTLYGYEEDEDSRFIYLKDCGHTIEAIGLTYYMEHNIEEGEIGAKICPRCKTIISHSKRFGNILRKRLKDVMGVKRRVFGNENVVKLKQKGLVEELSGNVEWVNITSQINPNVHVYFIDTLVQKGLLIPNDAKNQRVVLRQIPEGNMQSIELMVKHVKDVVDIYKKAHNVFPLVLIDSLKQKYFEQFNLLITRDLPLTKTEAANFDSEFDRLYDLYQLYKRRASPRFTNNHTSATLVYNTAMDMINSPVMYTKEMKNQLHLYLKEIDEKLRTGLGISERERREILSAFNTRQGRWFKCPNGHIYIITECGGAMQESKCSECSATVGGMNHRLRSDNTLASEMDGATAPLWPQ